MSNAMMSSVMSKEPTERQILQTLQVVQASLQAHPEISGVEAIEKIFDISNGSLGTAPPLAVELSHELLESIKTQIDESPKLMTPVKEVVVEGGSSSSLCAPNSLSAQISTIVCAGLYIFWALITIGNVVSKKDLQKRIFNSVVVVCKQSASAEIRVFDLTFKYIKLAWDSVMGDFLLRLEQSLSVSSDSGYESHKQHEAEKNLHYAYKNYTEKSGFELLQQVNEQVANSKKQLMIPIGASSQVNEQVANSKKQLMIPIGASSQQLVQWSKALVPSYKALVKPQPRDYMQWSKALVPSYKALVTTSKDLVLTGGISSFEVTSTLAAFTLIALYTGESIKASDALKPFGVLRYFTNGVYNIVCKLVSSSIQSTFISTSSNEIIQKSIINNAFVKVDSVKTVGLTNPIKDLTAAKILVTKKKSTRASTKSSTNKMVRSKTSRSKKRSNKKMMKKSRKIRGGYCPGRTWDDFKKGVRCTDAQTELQLRKDENSFRLASRHLDRAHKLTRYGAQVRGYFDKDMNEMDN